ncbi:hypothetical protein SAMN05421640_3234 [Ekhidna lutea]|uniref:Uncharacterized protein n=1 Tax=Ekhidna lutea TaxID=447679 RepID=A0A239LFW8_EKHLU|nr:hypothetical protein [Ekhidna lutea]SNT29245.1 hypothetical protein SAMN05421640_3234 [Ekhidna lutea]
MKKYVVTLILIMITITSVIFAYIKASEAEKYAEQVAVAQQEAERLRDEAVNLQEMAQEAAAEATLQMARAEEALRDCQSK